MANFLPTKLDGVVIIEPRIFEDVRGYLFESYNQQEFHLHGITSNFVQDNQSKSSYGVVRGLHCQIGEHAQGKLVRVLDGCVLDVAVDVRPNSPSFGQYVAVELSSQNQRQLYIPRGFLHGFAVLSETAIFSYKCDNFYAPQSELTVRFDDPDINVAWGIPSDKLCISEKDLKGRYLKDVKGVFYESR